MKLPPGMMYQVDCAVATLLIGDVPWKFFDCQIGSGTQPAA